MTDPHICHECGHRNALAGMERWMVDGIHNRPQRDLDPAFTRLVPGIPMGIEYILGDMLPEDYNLSMQYSPQYDHVNYTVSTHLYAQSTIPGPVVAAAAISGSSMEERIVQVLMMEHKGMIYGLATYLRQEANRLEGSLLI